MDATFRMRRSNRNQSLACLVGFLAWAALAIFAGLAVPARADGPMPDPALPRWALAGLLASLPLAMAALSAWSLAAYRRHELAIRGGRLAFRGVLRSRELDLGALTSARWRPRLRNGGLVLRSGSERLTLTLDDYETDEAIEIIEHLRATIPAEVQVGWNLFAYRVVARLSRATPRKPGPGEILLKRARWDFYFVPFAAVLGISGIAGWWTTGETRFGALLLMMVFVLICWVWMRATTPAEGLVTRTLSGTFRPGARRFLGFLLLWTLVAVGGIAAHDLFNSRLSHPNAVLIAGAVLWLGILLYEAAQQDRRDARRELEEADLAAKAHAAAELED